jgi:hypothetical protein
MNAYYPAFGAVAFLLRQLYIRHVARSGKRNKNYPAVYARYGFAFRRHVANGYFFQQW